MKIFACPVDKHNPLKLLIFEGQEQEVTTGVILCQECRRWYPIRDGIAEFLLDKYRDAERDAEFRQRWRDEFPEETKENGDES